LPGSRTVLGAVLAALLALPGAAPAQGAVRSVRLEADNDAFNFWLPLPRPDHDYTHGMRLTVDADAAPLWGARLAPGLRPCGRDAAVRCLASRLEVGQEIYTPRRDAPDPIPGERPYAGWLYAAGTARVLDPRSERTLGVEVGVTGPPSLAEAVQTGFHEVTGMWEPAGWEEQLGFEPAVAVRAGGARLVAEERAGGVRVLTLAPRVGVAVGNLLTGASAAVEARVGYGVPHPWGRGAGREPRVAVYATGAARGEWVLRNLFLDGSTFRESARVDKLPLVGEWEAALGVRAGDVVAAFRVVTRGREYHTGPAEHRFSGFVLGYERAR
jgi:lipid A 3-O-deacylase